MLCDSRSIVQRFGRLTKKRGGCMQGNVLRFFQVFLMWIGANFILFESLDYWKTLISALIFSAVYNMVWPLVLTKTNQINK